MAQEESGKKPKTPVRLTKAPPPIRPVRVEGSSGVSRLRKLRDCPSPDWTEWAHIPSVALEEACALSMCIDPHTLKYESMDHAFEPDTSDEQVKREFAKRVRMLKKNIYEPGFSYVPTGEVRLSEFVRWAQSIVKWPNLPPELSALAHPPASIRAAAPAERDSDASGDAALAHKVVGDWRAEARAIADELFVYDTDQNTRDCLLRNNGRGGYAFRVMDVMQQRGIHGPRGRIDNPKTIARDALQGDNWWRGKGK